MHWEILSKEKPKNKEELIKIILSNRKIKTAKQKREFFNPADPMEISLKSLDISEVQVGLAIERIKKAIKEKDHVIVYGDYDADGITGTATMWETLHALGVNVLPHIPDRFSEGYGLNIDSVKSLKEKDPKLSLIITVDHGITAGEKVGEVKKMGIDMIISDHHQAEDSKPKPLALVYSTQIGGSALSWVLAREITKELKIKSEKFKIEERLQFAAIGTIADQLPLVGPNRSIVKFGLQELNKTKRPGLTALIEESGIKNNIGTYEVGFIIAPRINSMGRLKNGIESLRLLCTGIPLKAKKLAAEIGNTNYERQRIVENVVVHAQKFYKSIESQSVIVLADEKYHEGVIGLAAAKLVEKFYRPAIVLSKNGNIAKASARSIPGFNIIENIRKLKELYIDGGGHPMAAGFSIYSENIDKFAEKINKIAKPLLTDEILSKKIKIDTELDFSDINLDLYKCLSKFEPFGLGNSAPVFATVGVGVVQAKTVGRESKHLKLKLRQNEDIFDSIYFGGGEMYSNLSPGTKLDIVYRIEENIWQGRINLQLVIRDVRIYNNI